MGRRLPEAGAVLLLTAAVCYAPVRASTNEYGKVELIRDRWGVPHVFAETDLGAMYGLGRAQAEDRAFQMYYSLRTIQGRLAEVVGDVADLSGRSSALQHDRKMRTFGFYRAAQAVVGNLDGETQALLRAYSAGVNDYVVRHRDELHPLFATTGLAVEPWTPADTIASWWRLGQFFAGDGTRDLMAWQNLNVGERPRFPADDAVAVVQREDVSDAWLARTRQFLAEHGLSVSSRPAASSEAGPTFSHAWVVGGPKTTTGGAVLVSDPQTPVRYPSLWHEFHICGKTFNARGIGIAGSPALLIGFNEHVAWGLTALGADQADLFRLKTDPARPDACSVDGRWEPMTVRRETIQVKGGRPLDLTVRETRFGPVVTPFAFPRPGDPEVALKRVPVCVTDRETIQGAIAMLRATDCASLARALAGWQFPSANVVFGDRKGNIGYWILAAIPVRSSADATQGAAALDGATSRSDWQGYVPTDLLPHVMNPARGWIASANHRPVGAFYEVPLGVSTGSMGDTTRSWRLRERLTARDRFSPKDVLDVHDDRVNPARRDIVRLGLHLRDVQKAALPEAAQDALRQLGPWYEAGARSDRAAPGADAAARVTTFFRVMATPLAESWGGGESGLCRFLRTAVQRVEADPRATLSADEQAFIVQALTVGSAVRGGGVRAPAPARPPAGRAGPPRARLFSFESLDGFPSPDPTDFIPMPDLADTDGGTINCQSAQSYTQFVPLHDVDAALSILPPGQSELPACRYRSSTLDLWRKGELHPAPLSRAAVEKIADKEAGDGRP
jgi:penicillin amidase